MARRIGIYPGTFDPLHKGHLAFAKKSLAEFELDTIYFLPEATPRRKPNVNALDMRIAQLEEALNLHEDLDIFRAVSRQFTVRETLPELNNFIESDSFTLLVGSDVFENIVYWDELEMLLPNIDLAVGLRHDSSEAAIMTVMNTLEQKHGVRVNYKIIHDPATHHFSSTMFREQKKRA